MTKIHFDFETRSEADIKVCGSWAYAHHPSTKVMCIAYKINDEETKIWKNNDSLDKDYEDFLKVLDTADELYAHNALFEIAILDAISPGRYDINKFRCTMQIASMFGLPKSLGDLGVALKCKNIKDEAGSKIMLSLVKPRKATKKDDRKFLSDVSLDSKLEEERKEKMNHMYEYCIDDVNCEYEISAKLKTIPNFERAIQQHDLLINSRGFSIDYNFAEALSDLIDYASEKVDSEIQRLTEGRVTKVTQGKVLMEELAKYGVLTDSLAADTVATLLEDETLDETARYMLELRQLGSKSSTAKVKAFIHYGITGRVCNAFQYYGAHTGRWSGKGPQPQNLPATHKIDSLVKSIDEDRLRNLVIQRDFDTLTDIVNGKLSHVVSLLIRSIIVPSEGKKMYIGDFAGIELRVLMELAGQDDVTTHIKNGNDLYKLLACKIYDKKVEDITKDERTVGKTAILGCGYGMGAGRFTDLMKLSGIQGTMSQAQFDTLCRSAVETYRNEYGKVSEFWEGLEQAFRDCIRFEKTIEYKLFKCEFKQTKFGTFVWIHLPTGRFISYWNPRLKNGKIELYKPIYKSYNACWGGVLVENVTQGVSRDILAKAMLRLEEKGYNVILHVHDEIVCEVNEDYTEEDIQSIEEIFEARGEWWSEDFCMKVEGHVTEHYTK